MSRVRQCDLDRFLCWVLFICFSTALIMLAFVLVMGLAHTMIKVVRGEPNEICLKPSEMNQMMHSKRLMIVSANDVDNTKN